MLILHSYGIEFKKYKIHWLFRSIKIKYRELFMDYKLLKRHLTNKKVV